MKITDLRLKLKTLNIEVLSHMSSIDMDLLDKLDFENIPKYSFANELENKFNIDIESIKKRYKAEKGFNKNIKQYKPETQNIKIKFDTNQIIKALFKVNLGFNFNSDLYMIDKYLNMILKFLDNNEKIYEHLFFSELLEHDFSSEEDLDEFINYGSEFIISNFKNFKEDDNFNYIKILTKSLFISAYSMLEYCLDEICKKISTIYDYKLKLADIAGKGITRSHKYIKKVIKIDFPDTSESWRNIKNYNEIRNVIIHSQSTILPDNLKIKQIIEEYKGIKIIDDQIILSQYFLRLVFDDIAWLLNDIENKVVEKFYNLNK